MYKLGWQHQYGQGVGIHIVKSREYYQRAAEAGDVNSKKQLLILDNSKYTAAQWLELGENYYYGRNGKIKDCDMAHVCFQEVIRLNPLCPQAHFWLGWLHQYGQSVDISHVQAKVHYEYSERGGNFSAIIQ